ncbi:hypothetical protein K492DRAFT_198973 [Lichtheimia hyalospora FSU 10163]|nr:hypothetical protein K492DRAFT_198973 [Lichtheimia hyalospora FSU 10163]
MTHLKSTWSSFFSRFHHDNNNTPPNGDRRRPSHTSSCSSLSMWSDTGSTFSERKKSSRGLSIPSLLLRRRGSGTSTSTSCSSLVLDQQQHDMEKETQRLQSLYELALDEIKYAEDSRGSPYYTGDRVTAREAIDGCATAVMELQQQNPTLQPLIHSTMAPRLIELETKYHALPKPADEA